MKSTALLAGILWAALIPGCAGGTSPTGPLTPASGVGAPRPTLPAGQRGFAQLVAEYDANGDGKLEISEMPAGARYVLHLADTNHDGVISEAEIAAYRLSLARERFDALDANHDGALSRTEAGPMWERIDDADTNRDGEVTWSEFKAARAEFWLRPPRRR